MTRQRRLLQLAVWLMAVAAVVGLGIERLRDARQPNQALDFMGFFLPAGHVVAEGGSPYDVVGYGYSPLVAGINALAVKTSDPLAWWLGLILVAGLVAVVATWRTYAAELPAWRGPAFVAAAGATLLWSRPTTLELFLAQCQLIVLACLAVAALCDARGRHAAAGALVVLAGLVKTWPAGALFWFLRRGAAGRVSSLVAAAVTGLVALVVFVTWLGPGVLGDWASNTAGLSVQHQPAYSMFGLGRTLFSGPEAVAAAPVLRWAVTVAGSLFVLALLGVVLTRPGDPVLALWHVVCVVLLLLPVSHYPYLVLLTPIVWVYLARLLAPRAGRSGLLVSVVVLSWWLVVFRMPLTGPVGLATVVVSTVVMLTASVLSEARATAKPVVPQVRADKPVSRVVDIS